MADKLIYNSIDDIQNKPIRKYNSLLKRFDTQLNEPTNQIQ